MGGSLTREIIIFILVYESTDDRRTLAQTHTGEPKGTAVQTSYKEGKEEKNSGGRTPNDATGMCYRAFLREQVINETFKPEWKEG